MKVRKAAFAGSWYPDRAAACEKEIKQFLKKSDFQKISLNNIIGGIVPHAGWYFSGAIACNVIRLLHAKSAPDVIVMLGMHLHSDSPVYMIADDVWETPFGSVEIEKELAGEITKQLSSHIEPLDNFMQDNTIELQLPFIKYFFPDAKILPIGVPPLKRSFEIGNALAEIAAGLDQTVKVIGSTDLTHYGSNYGFTPKGTGHSAVDWVKNENDRRVINAMLSMDADLVISEAKEHQNACCAGAAAIAILAAKGFGATKAESIAYSNSYDINPDRSFVGYAGIVFGNAAA